MTIHQQILLLLSQKKEIFLEIEAVTTDMCVLPIEELVIHTDKRSSLLEQISAIDIEIQALCNGDTEILAALNNTSPRGTLPPELGKFYDASLSVKAVVNRILKNEDSVRMYLASEKERIIEKVQALNHSGESVANRYHQSVQAGLNKPLDLGNDKMV